MKVTNLSLSPAEAAQSLDLDFSPDLFILFSGSKIENIQEVVSSVKTQYPVSYISGCSTSGEISDITVKDDSISLTAIKFDESSFKKISVDISDVSESHSVGQQLMNGLPKEGLRHVLIFSDGLHVNGAELVKGLKNDLPKDVNITGGLAGDGADFVKTFIIDDGIFEKRIVAIGLYGSSLKIGYGSKGGWDSFGIERKVTKSDGSILYELDGEPALDIYKSFLGDKAKDLPGSGLLFPLSLREDENLPVVRTILAVDEESKSLTFAGSIPTGAYVRFMKANIDRVIDGAADSAETSYEITGQDTELAILISCVGRKLVLKQLVEEEVDAVREVIGDQAVMTGFYSYGEIAPFAGFSPCQLHNQTMTITTISE